MKPKLRQLMQEAGYASPEHAKRAQELARLVVGECVAQAVLIALDSPEDSEACQTLLALTKTICGEIL